MYVRFIDDIFLSDIDDGKIGMLRNAFRNDVSAIMLNWLNMLPCEFQKYRNSFGYFWNSRHEKSGRGFPDMSRIGKASAHLVK